MIKKGVDNIMTKSSLVMKQMILYFGNDTRRIHHFMKVFSYAKLIGEMEGLEKEKQEILEVAALTHDIGIKISEEKYQSSSGEYQQIEGPPEAKKMLEQFMFEEDFIDRICYLIGHHHTYHEINGLDYQILVEADFLVNIAEDQMEQKAILYCKDKIFKTKTGIELLESLYEKN